jgi:hypothetical protein
MSQLKQSGENIGWKNINADLRNRLKECDVCNRWNLGAKTFQELGASSAYFPFDRIQLDFITSFEEENSVCVDTVIRKDKPVDNTGYKNILVIVDTFTGFAILRATRTRSAEELVAVLWSVFCLFGIPKEIQMESFYG